jgi:hypothetical protein
MPIIVVYGSSFLLKGVAKVRNKKLMSFLKYNKLYFHPYPQCKKCIFFKKNSLGQKKILINFCLEEFHVHNKLNK